MRLNFRLTPEVKAKFTEELGSDPRADLEQLSKAAKRWIFG